MMIWSICFALCNCTSPAWPRSIMQICGAIWKVKRQSLGHCMWVGILEAWAVEDGQRQRKRNSVSLLSHSICDIFASKRMTLRIIFCHSQSTVRIPHRQLLCHLMSLRSRNSRPAEPDSATLSQETKNKALEETDEANEMKGGKVGKEASWSRVRYTKATDFWMDKLSPCGHHGRTWTPSCPNSWEGTWVTWLKLLALEKSWLDPRVGLMEEIKFPVEDLMISDIFLTHSSKTSRLVPVEQNWTWKRHSESQKHAWTCRNRICKLRVGRKWYRPDRMYFSQVNSRCSVSSYSGTWSAVTFGWEDEWTHLVHVAGRSDLVALNSRNDDGDHRWAIFMTVLTETKVPPPVWALISTM
jgi:hypothetical protein